ncbi:MAG: HAD family phosphatase, partial [Planctomycetes bacterium]|nr:HAD family phosphatase [Planctomycetota bacterium]
MIDAIIFDCDGVIIDSEPIHLACFREVLKQEGLELSDEDYYDK